MSQTRRDFLMASSSLITASGVIGVPMSTFAQTGGAITEHKLPELPYPYDALEPYIDARTMELHHTKHHAAYVKGLNTAESALAEARAKNDFLLIQHWSKQAAFHGGGHFLHSMFWKVMAPPGNGGGGKPEGELLGLIERDFGSFESFQAHFSAAANAVEGGGWALLHYRPIDGRLIVLQAENQHKLTAWGVLPIMGIDVWEHAYYLKYQNNRSEYVKAWWNVVNWSQVAKNLGAIKGIALL
ncbi:MAG: superoxide dismutase [Candidatus Hydrogenedentes bacterium]|nr:superoxide dismutase [Candidatus Hydrogenedentota bacterium]